MNDQSISANAAAALKAVALQNDPALLSKVLARQVAPVVLIEAAKMALGESNVPVQWDPNDFAGYARALVDRLIEAKALPVFFAEIVRSSSHQVFEQILDGGLEVDSEGELTKPALESLRAEGQDYLNSCLFGDFVVSARMQVCAIWIRQSDWPAGVGRIYGSGFLIGPDKVMTARHVLDNALDDPIDAPVVRPGVEVRCIFDYFAPIPEAMNRHPFKIPESLTSYAVAPGNWLLWSSPTHPDDGRDRTFRDHPDVSQYIDCAVIALAESVGLLATRRGGGRRRSWLDLSGAEYAPLLTKGDYVVVIHHPDGLDQKISIDRLEGQEPTKKARIWYAARTQGGSSGSPCFNDRGKLIALHNSGYLKREPVQPHDKCNQGVRMDYIRGALPPALLSQAGTAQATDTLWAIPEEDGKFRPVLGRLSFKELALGMTDPASRRRALIVKEKDDVAGRADGSAHNTGKSYSAEILRALARDRKSFVLCFEAQDLRRLTPFGFLKELCFKLGSAVGIETAPEKPTDERQLSRWASTELPNWFGRLIEEWALGGHLTNAQGQPLATGTAAETAPHLGLTIWIVIDNIHRNAFEGEMKELIAGLVGVTESQVVRQRGLGALRWLFIGNIPDFVRDTPAHAELLAVDDISPAEIAEEQFLQFLRAYEASRGGISLASDEHLRSLFEVLSALAENQPAERLPLLNAYSARYLNKLIALAAARV